MDVLVWKACVEGKECVEPLVACVEGKCGRQVWKALLRISLFSSSLRASFGPHPILDHITSARSTCSHGNSLGACYVPHLLAQCSRSLCLLQHELREVHLEFLN
jgi:hypothetical protein